MTLSIEQIIKDNYPKHMGFTYHYWTQSLSVDTNIEISVTNGLCKNLLHKISDVLNSLEKVYSQDFMIFSNYPIMSLSDFSNNLRFKPIMFTSNFVATIFKYSTGRIGLEFYKIKQ